ncbi:hypothetical protein AtNW77_Chr4g0278811 [Arabidopsis thaliana]|uniref:Uncharacterized protein n=2 Tax=Arabidopsis TaxID=3701 RepID=A0A178UZT2_ARATH|nr:hypothetical protein ISN45_At04g006290 [Arabidopsis thaliana x Arabidopsis arenosa]OAO99175.1 hypothetical protein AXX17_AT4G06940 [Arabidopsis thaliana]CAA0393844.1 unnamed protein product [Arabidopsis thaliana]
MRIVSEHDCPKSVEGLSYDPEPNRSFDHLVSETESFEKKLNAFTKFHQPFTKTTSRTDRAFVMRVSKDDIDSDDEDVENNDQQDKEESQICTCDDLYLSDDDEFDHELQYTKSTEDIKNQVSVVEKEIRNEIERALSAIALVDKYRENRREVERSLDLQYKREVAEALETHMNAVKREHAIISYIEERKIRREEA